MGPDATLPPSSAFNNILSNLGYVLLGLLFLLIILQREIHYNRALVRNDFQAVVRHPLHRGPLSPQGHTRCPERGLWLFASLPLCPPQPALCFGRKGELGRGTSFLRWASLPRSVAFPNTLASSTPWAPPS